MDATLHDVVLVHDFFFKPRFVIRILEMTGDHNRFLVMRIPRTPATATAPEADRYQDEGTHDDSHGDKQDGDPRATVGEIPSKLVMEYRQLLLTEA
jgi:hypothetical protein